MYRNLDKRVETMTIVEEELVKKEIKEILDLYLKDNVKSRILLSDGLYTKIDFEGKNINAQEELLFLSKKYNKK